MHRGGEFHPVALGGVVYAEEGGVEGGGAHVEVVVGEAVGGFGFEGLAVGFGAGIGHHGTMPGGQWGVLEFGGADEFAAVEQVADDGAADVAEVHADLVGAAGLDFDFNEAVPVVAFADSVDGSTGLAVVIVADGLGFFDGVVRAEGGFDHTGRFFEAAGGLVDEGEVALEVGFVFELFAEFPVSFIGFGDNHHAGGVFVEAVDDAGARAFATIGVAFAADGGEVAGEDVGGWFCIFVLIRDTRAFVALRLRLGVGVGFGWGWGGFLFLLEVVGQGVEEGAFEAASCGVDDEVGLFVHGEEVVVFKQDIEGDVLGFEVVAGFGREDHIDDVAAFEFGGGFDAIARAVDLDAAEVNELLNLGAANAFDAVLQVFVESQLGITRQDVAMPHGAVVVGE